MQTIYREADRAAKIVRNLLVFAGSRRLRAAPVSLNAVLQKVRGTAQRPPAVPQDIEVVRHYDEKLPRVQSDPLLLHQVFLNMVMNAEHAIAATGQRRPHRDQRRRWRRRGDRIVATVRDTGTGIPPDALSRIFEPFYTTKEVGKGTGLGLAITYGIVQEHGGQIVAANHPDGGAVFTVELPIDAGRQDAERMIDETFLTTEEVLEYLQVNLRTVYRLIKAGKIPAVRVGRQWRFRKRDIDAVARQPASARRRRAPRAAPRRAARPATGARASARPRRRRRGEHPRSAGEDARARRIRRGRRARRPLGARAHAAVSRTIC